MSSYFSHDSNARSDSKIIALRIKHQWAGYGLYWALIEKLRDSTYYKLAPDYNLLAYDLRAEPSMIKSIINDFGLFVFTNDGAYFYSESLLRRMEEKDAKSAKARESINKRWEKVRAKHEGNTNVSNSDTNVILIKEKKGKEKKDIILSSDNTSDNSNELPVIVPPSAYSIPFGKIVDMWNSTCTGYRRVMKLSDVRKNKVRIRIDEMGGLDKAIPILQCLFEKMQESNFLRGESSRGFKADFDWVFTNGANWVKIFEGKYDNKKELNNNGTSHSNVGTSAESDKESRDRAFAEHIASKLGGGDTR